jgi:hypothetical protein
MSLNVIVEVWKALKSEIDEANLPDAAESLVTVLVDNGYDAGEIKDEFRKETHVLNAVKDYVASHEDEEEYEDYEEDEEDYDDKW